MEGIKDEEGRAIIRTVGKLVHMLQDTLSMDPANFGEDDDDWPELTNASPLQAIDQAYHLTLRIC